jgi:hypothetical protein
MTVALYLAVAVATLLAWNRWVTKLSRTAAIVLILLPFPFVGPALLTDRVYGGHDMIFLSQPWSDYAADYGVKLPWNWYLLDQALALAPWAHQVRAALAHHQWPLWNPGMNSGDILAASMQVAPYNPLNLIGLLLPVGLAATFSAAMIFFLAGLFTFAFARELECNEGASLVAAMGFAYCGAVTFWVGWSPLSSWVLLPFVLLGIRRGFTLLTIALTLLILFGHPETMLHVVAIGAAYGLLECGRLARTGRASRPAAVIPPDETSGGRGRDARTPLRAITAAVGAGITALLLTAIFILPFFAVLHHTWQYELFKEQAHGPSPIAFNAIGATFIPYYGGASWYNLTRQFDFGMARVGSVILALAVVASIRLWRRREVRFFIVLAVIALLAAWSALPLLRKIPLFAVAKNERLGFAAAFALSILAAMAFDAMSRKVVIAVGAMLMITTALLWQTRLGFGVQPKLMLIGATAEVLGIVALLRPRLAFALVLGAIAVQRVAEDGFIYPALPQRLFYPEVPLIKAIPRDPLYRVVGTANLFIPNAASMVGLEDVRGYASLTYAPYKKTMALWCPTAQKSYNDVTDLTLPFLSFLGVRYAVTPRSMEPPDGWRVVTDDRQTRLMENARAVPRLFAPRTIRFMNSDDTELEEMRQATDFGAKAWIHSDEVMPQDVDNGQAALKVRRVGSRYEVDVDARSGSHIVIADVGWPGWRAYVDGRRVKIATANLAFLAVYVPQGRHRLRLVYLPDAFVRGRAISFGTLAVLLIVTALRARRRAAGSPARAARAR